MIDGAYFGQLGGYWYVHVFIMCAWLVEFINKHLQSINQSSYELGHTALQCIFDQYAYTTPWKIYSDWPCTSNWRLYDMESLLSICRFELSWHGLMGGWEISSSPITWEDSSNQASYVSSSVILGCNVKILIGMSRRIYILICVKFTLRSSSTAATLAGYKISLGIPMGGPESTRIHHNHLIIDLSFIGYAPFYFLQKYCFRSIDVTHHKRVIRAAKEDRLGIISWFAASECTSWSQLNHIFYSCAHAAMHFPQIKVEQRSDWITNPAFHMLYDTRSPKSDCKSSAMRQPDS